MIATRPDVGAALPLGERLVRSVPFVVRGLEGSMWRRWSCRPMPHLVCDLLSGFDVVDV